MHMIDIKRKENLLRSMERLEAYQEIQNQMGRMIAAFNFREAEKVLGYFALEMEDVSLEVADEGVFEGPEAVETIIRETVGKAPQKGEMIDIQLTTPIVEVAQDLQSARALWWCPGAASFVQTGDLPEEKASQAQNDPQAVWLWGDIAVDFVNTEEGWKIHHLHYFRVIKCSYEKGWVEDTSMINRPNTAMHPLSKPTTFHNPYSPLSIRYGLPAAPYPYESDDGENWMLRNDKTK